MHNAAAYGDLHGCTYMELSNRCDCRETGLKIFFLVVLVLQAIGK